MAEDLTPEEQQANDSRDFARVKQQLKTAETERDSFKALFETARTQLISSAVQIAGFKPNDAGEFEGVTALLVKEFKGSLGDTDLPDPSSFASLAQQFGVTSTPAAAGDAGDDNDGKTVTLDLAAQIAAIQAPGDALGSLGKAPVPADLDEKIAAAEKAGDVAASIALKQQKSYGSAAA